MIEAHALTKQFGAVRALNAIELTIESGRPTGLVGPNGAGKTTLFSVLCGFLNPTAGQVSIFGQPPLDRALHGRISILPQDAELAHGVPVIKQLTYMAELQGFDRRAAASESSRVLSLVNLSASARSTPDQLSHGMKKRVAIAQAFLGSPDLVLLDEPTAGLDPNTAAPIRELIRSTAAQRKYIISSHNLADIEDLCGDVVILKQGQVSQHTAITTLVGRTSSLTIVLEEPAPESLEGLCMQVDGVDRVEVPNDDRSQVRVGFAAERETDVHIGVLQMLKTANVEFRELTRGESLESRVREITR